jgi:hypothetical protein
MTMTKAGRKSPRRQPPQAPIACWLDLFERPLLGGTIRRLHGPGEFRDVQCNGSLIVGPGARLVRRDSRSADIIGPGQVVPRLRRTLDHFELLESESRAAGK